MIRMKSDFTYRTFRSGAVSCLAALLLMPFSVHSLANDDCYSSFDEADYSDAREYCQSIAELGDARAAFLLATIYYQGLDVPVDDQRGLFWDEVAAEKGHPEAAYRLALAYQLGQGVSQSNTQARRWYMQAALARHPKAQKQLGAMFETGITGEVNLEKAFEWYLKAARQGLADAQLRAGTMLLEGVGIEKDEAHAQHWIRKAAEAGNANAQVALGVMLVQIDPAESVSWYKKSAHQGNGLAMQNLASMYYTGEGVDKNHPLALELAQRAVSAGNMAAKPLLSRIQLEEQQQRIADLQAEKQRLSVQLAQIPSQTVVGEVAAEDVTPEPTETLALISMPEPAAGHSEVITTDLVSARADNGLDKVQLATVTAAENPFLLPDGWIMGQSKKSYTIQLTNGPDEVGIHKYIQQKRLPEEVRYYRTRRDAGVFYVLIYGEYPSVASAREALKSLPAAARRDHWIRNISTLQKHYRQP